MTDQERKDLAQAYRTMMDLAAWKHFVTGLDRIAEMATKDEDMIPTEALDRSIGAIGEARGKRAAIHKIRQDLAFILEA